MSSENSSPRDPAGAASVAVPFTVVPNDQTLAKWICPACTGIGSDRHRTCPRCGRSFVPGALSSENASAELELRSTTRRLWLGLILGLPLIGMGIANAMVIGRPISAALGDKNYLALQALLCTPVVVICGAPFFLRAWRSIRTRRLNIYTLIGLGAGAAYVYSLVGLIYVWSGVNPLPRQTVENAELRPEVKGGLEILAPNQLGTIDPFFESAAMIVLLVLIGQVLEVRARSRTSAAIQKLLPLIPTNARIVLPDGREEERPLDQVRPGDLLRVRPGERLPVDGVVREGSTTVDESMLTGEPARAGRGIGSWVLAGSENGLGAIVVEATRVKDETVLDQVIGIVARAQERRVTLERTTDRIARVVRPDSY